MRSLGLFPAGQRLGTDTHSRSKKVVRDAPQKELLRPTNLPPSYLDKVFGSLPACPPCSQTALRTSCRNPAANQPAASCRYTRASCVCLRVPPSCPRAIESGTRRTEDLASTEHRQHTARPQPSCLNEHTDPAGNTPGVLSRALFLSRVSGAGSRAWDLSSVGGSPRSRTRRHPHPGRGSGGFFSSSVVLLLLLVLLLLR